MIVYCNKKSSELRWELSRNTGKKKMNNWSWSSFLKIHVKNWILQIKLLFSFSLFFEYVKDVCHKRWLKWSQSAHRSGKIRNKKYCTRIFNQRFVGLTLAVEIFPGLILFIYFRSTLRTWTICFLKQMIVF